MYFSLSIVWSMKTCINLHRKTLKTQKIFFGFSPSFFAMLWALVATMRRLLAIIGFFTPSLGLFNILNHWLAEQYPYTIRRHPLPIDKIQLFNMTEKILWSELDRSRYEVPDDPSTPSYSMYTGFTLQYYLVLFFIIMSFHCVAMALAKKFTSEEFKKGGKVYNRMIHVIENINFSFPYKDWDEGMFTIEEYRRRHENTEIEMLWTFAVNSVFSLVMLVPIWFTGEINYFLHL